MGQPQQMSLSVVWRSHLHRLAFMTAAVSFALAVPTVYAQVHSRDYGQFTVRSSTVGSINLAEETAAEHGIERDPRRGVLNVTVLRREQRIKKTVPASVSAYVMNLTGQRRHIDLQEITAEGRVSYVGTYQFTNGEVLDFRIQAKPDGSNEVFRLRFRDRLWARQ